jgi:hypothetical protein
MDSERPFSEILRNSLLFSEILHYSLSQDKKAPEPKDSDA